MVPFYLEAAAQQYGLRAGLIKEAGRVNDAMPIFVVDKAERLLRERGDAPARPRLLLIGITYKANIRDLRESAALAVLRECISRGHDVVYHDPLVESVEVGGFQIASVALTPDEVRRADCVILLTSHSTLDRELLLTQSRLLLDTQNTFRGQPRANVVPL